jgi:hypothetical protein
MIAAMAAVVPMRHAKLATIFHSEQETDNHIAILHAAVYAQVNAEKREARHKSREQLAAKYSIDTTRFKAAGTSAKMT